MVINQEEESDVVCVLGGESVSWFLNHTPQTQLEQTIWWKKWQGIIGNYQLI